MHAIYIDVKIVLFILLQELSFHRSYNILYWIIYRLNYIRVELNVKNKLNLIEDKIPRYLLIHK